MAKKRSNNSTQNYQGALSSLKKRVIGTKKNTGDEIDASLARISGSIIDKDASNYAEMMLSIYSKILGQEFNFKTMPRGIFQGYMSVDRYSRYINSEEIVDCIPYCARALKVLVDEITAPDDITKVVLRFFQDELESDASRISLENVQSINKCLKIDRHIHDIISDTLKYGDQFVEICDYMSKDVPITQLILSESKKRGLKEEPTYLKQLTIKYPNDIEDLEGKDKGTELTLNPIVTVVTESKKNEKRKGSKKTEAINIDNIRLIIHDSRYVIKLQSERFKMCLGYLILPKYAFGSSALGTGGAASVPNLLSMLGGGLTYKNVFGIDALYTDIMTLVKRHLGDKEFRVAKDEVKNMIMRSIAEFEQEETTDFKIRFVPPERMEHFVLGKRRFFPYGESIFCKITFAAKLLIALETAITIKRVADSSDKRIMYIETGTPRNVRDLIEEIKETMKKRRISIDSMGSIGSIPSMITNYEDYYIPQHDGKRYIEFDTLPPTVQIRDLTEELKYFRDSLVAALDVPPSFLGVEENLSQKASLSVENVLFARTIVSYQSYLTIHVWSLFNKVHKFIYDELLSENIRITFSPPRTLQVEHESDHIRIVVDLINSLKELGIDEEYLKRKYLPLDWDEIEKSETQSKLDSELEKGEGEEEGGVAGF